MRTTYTECAFNPKETNDEPTYLELKFKMKDQASAKAAHEMFKTYWDEIDTVNPEKWPIRPKTSVIGKNLYVGA